MDFSLSNRENNDTKDTGFIGMPPGGRLPVMSAVSFDIK